MLNNERFVSKAPAAKVEEERTKLQKYKDMMEKVTVQLANLNK
jgi:valyl-tRNA synthetase